MFTIWFTNHGYRSPQLFATLDEAKAHVQRVAFEACIDETSKKTGEMVYTRVASWSPITGWRRHSVSLKVNEILEGAKG